MLPVFAQFTFTVAGGEATVTGYTGTGGNLVIPDTLGGVPVTKIGDDAFKGITSITSVALPGSVTAIGQKAFESCTQLTSISLPSSVATIGNFAFAGCSSLTSITLPTSLTSLSDYLFQGCSALTSVIVPNGVTTVGANAFESCGNLASVTLPGSLILIKSGAFFLCSSLTRITIPASVSTIEFNAFLNSSTLAEVKFEGANPPISIGANAFTGLAAGAKGIYPASASANWSSVVIPGLLLEPGALTVAAQPVISSGWNHTLYLPVSGGSALAWGFNSDGRCGLGHTNSPVVSGERITGAGGTTLSNLVAVAAGGGHSLVLQANTGIRSLFTAGANSSGQLGLSAVASTNRFAAVTGPFTNPLAIAAGGRHSLVLDADGKVYTFGDNASGQLGQGGTTPVSVTNATLVPSLTNIQAIAAGTDHSLALTIGGQVYAWGRANGGTLGFPGLSGIGTPRLLATNVTAGGVTNANGMTNLVQIVAGERHSLFLRGDGKVFASGVNSAGQLGLGSGVVSAAWPTEVPIPGGVAIQRISGGLRGAHALAVDGRVFAWGYNEYGELGLGTATTNSPYAIWTPTEVPAFYRAQQIASGTFQTFALDESGSLLAAGYNQQGQLGVGGTINVTATPAPTSEAGKTNQTINFAVPVGPFYVGGTTNLPATSTSGLPVAFFSSDTNRATVSSNTVTFRALGPVTITARQPGNGSFNAAPAVSRILSVQTRPAPALSLPGSLSGTVGVPFSYRLVSDDSSASYAATGLPAGLELNPVTGEITGTPAVATTGTVVSIAASNSSGTGTGTINLIVGKGNQSIIFSPLPSKTFGEAAFNLSATAGSGLPVSYSSSNTNVATVSGNTLTIVGAGTATITASQAGNANWDPAISVSYPLTVNKATPTISAAPTASGITYGQTLADSTLAGGEAKLGTNVVAGSFAFTTPTLTPNAGTANQGVTFTPTDTVNYNTTSAVVSVTVNKATPTISAAPTASAIPAGQALSDSALSGGSASVPGTFAWTVPALIPSASGEYSVTFTPTDAANYTTVTALVNVSVTSANTLPTIAPITDRVAGLGAAQNIGLFVSDNETTTASLSVSATASNGTLFPLGSLVAAYSGSAWLLTATPATGEFGEANITVTVTDGAGATAQTIFKITVYDAYNTWARLTQGLTGSDAAAGADPDGDGVVNALEFNDGVDSSNPSTPNPVIGYLGLIQVYQQKDASTPGLGSLWQKIGGSNVVAERVVFAKTATNLAAAAVPVQRLPGTPLVGLTNRTVVGAYDEFEEGEADLQSYVDTSAAETALPSGTYLFAPQAAAGGPVGVSNTVVWGTGTYPSQAPKITVDAWSNNVLRITNVASANAITWESWAGSAKDQIRLELRKISGPSAGGGPKFMLPASASSQTLVANSLEENSVYEGSIVFMQTPNRGAIRGRSTQFYLSTGPDFPAPTTGADPAFIPAVGVYGESFSFGTVSTGGTVPVTGSNLGGLTKDSFDLLDTSSGSSYFILNPVAASANTVTIPIPATLLSGSYQLRYKGGTDPQVLGVMTVTGGSSPFANNVSMTSTASVINVPMPSAALGSMTLEFWIKPASGLNSGTYRVVSKNGSTGGPELAIDLNYTSSTVANLSATVTPSIGSPAVASANFINPLAWTHVALVISSSTALLYLDGVPGAGSGLSGTLGWGTQPMVFGNGFRGQLDDIRIYSGSRTGTQIGADKSGPAFSPYETSLVAYYKLEEGAGTSLADATGKNGAATGGNIAWGPGRSPGVWNIASGDYSQENDGTQLLMELGGTEGTTLYDQIFVRNGAATLDGIVNLMFIGAYTGPVSGSWHTFNLIWAQNGIVFGDNYQLVFDQPGFSVDTAVVEKDGGQLWQATVRQAAAAAADTAQAANLSRPSLGIAQSPGPAGSVELMYTYTRPVGGSYLNGQYVVGGVRYELQVSHDLKTWSPATVEEVAALPAETGYEKATVRVVSGTGRAFLRLKVSD